MSIYHLVCTEVYFIVFPENSQYFPGIPSISRSPGKYEYFPLFCQPWLVLQELVIVVWSTGHGPAFVKNGLLFQLKADVLVYPGEPIQDTCFLRPKIKFYLFAIAYLPTLLPPTQLFFCFSRTIFFFFFFFFFAVSIFQFQSEILKLYKLTGKKNPHDSILK